MTCFFSSIDATALQLAPFGQGLGPIWLNYLECVGSEDLLVNCSSSCCDSHIAECGHHEDAGLRCQRELQRARKKAAEV